MTPLPDDASALTRAAGAPLTHGDWLRLTLRCLVIYALVVSGFHLLRPDFPTGGWRGVGIGVLLQTVLGIAVSFWIHRWRMRHALRWDGVAGELEVRHHKTGETLVRSARASLDGASLKGRPLKGANLYAASLRGADLSGADLTGAVLDYADLQGADLRGACLAKSSLLRTDLRHANLVGADLGLSAASELTSTRFLGAIFDATTRWPEGFNPDRAGCRRPSLFEPDLPLPASSQAPDASSYPIPS